jgi:hypothetical protein
MRHTIWTGTCAAIVGFASVGMLAQTSSAPPTPQQNTPSSSDKKIVVTGCLKAAPQTSADAGSAAGTTGTAGTAGTAGSAVAGTSGAAAEPKFVLTGASASSPDSPSTAQTYRLIANPTALTDHVGKKLELTGTLDPNSTPDPKDPSASAPALRVESGKIVAASCSE